MTTALISYNPLFLASTQQNVDVNIGVYIRLRPPPVLLPSNPATFIMSIFTELPVWRDTNSVQVNIMITITGSVVTINGPVFAGKTVGCGLISSSNIITNIRTWQDFIDTPNASFSFSSQDFILYYGFNPGPSSNQPYVVSFTQIS